MPSPGTLQPVNFFAASNPDLSQQQMALAQQQALAQKMMEEGSTPIDPMRQAGGWVVPISPMEGALHAGKQLASAMMQRNINEQQATLGQKQMAAMVQMLRGGAPAPAMQTNPMSPQAATPSVLAGSGDTTPAAPTAAASPSGAGGVDTGKLMQLYAANAMFGPAGGAFLQKQFEPTDLQKNIEAAGYAPNSPQAQAAFKHTLDPNMSTRYGIYDSSGNIIGGAMPPNAMPIQRDSNGQPIVKPYAGQLESAQAIAEAEQRGKQPFGMSMMKVPVYLPGGDQTEVNLNSMQAEQYNRTGQLPPEIAASIPGYQQPQSAMPPVNPQQPMVPGTRMSNPPMSVVPPEDRQAFNAAIPAQAFNAAQRPVAGRGQTQTEQIRQTGQTAANTEAAKEFISEMRQNYSKLRDVPATLENMDRAKQLAATSARQFMGPFGDSKLAVTKFLRSNLPGMGSLNTEGVTNAEELQSTLFNQVMDNLKKMDASPSQYQQQVMQEAFGTLRTDPQSVPKILNVFEDILRNRVSIHNDTVKSAEGRGTVFPYDVSVKVPEPKAKGAGAGAPSGGQLSPAEQQELDVLRKRFGRR